MLLFLSTSFAKRLQPPQCCRKYVNVTADNVNIYKCIYAWLRILEAILSDLNNARCRTTFCHTPCLLLDFVLSPSLQLDSKSLPCPLEYEHGLANYEYIINLIFDTHRKHDRSNSNFYTKCILSLIHVHTMKSFCCDRDTE